MTGIKSLLIRSLLKSTKAAKSVQPKYANKVTIVGAGAVGAATAFGILTKGISNNVAIIDMNKNLVEGEVMDLQHGSIFLQNARIEGGTDFKLSKDSRICIVTAGARQKVGETRMNLVQRNVDIVKSIVLQLLKYSPETIILMVTNPVDVLTYVTWKITDLPKHRIIGSGTNLDSARYAPNKAQNFYHHFFGFRFSKLLSQKLKVAPTSCHGNIVGEHGDASVALWSMVNIAGIRLREIKPKIATPDDDEDFGKIHKEVVNAAYNIIKLKGYTSWAVALSLADIVECIFKDTANVRQVTVSVKGLHGVEDEVFMSTAAVLEVGQKNCVLLQIVFSCVCNDAGKWCYWNHRINTG